MTRLFLLDVINNKAHEIQVGAGLDDYYKHLGCDCFDIANRRLGDRRFDIFVDDEGLLKDNPTISAITADNEPMLVGNLIFANHDGQGNTISLSDNDIETIKSHIREVQTFRKTNDGYEIAGNNKMVVGLEY